MGLINVLNLENGIDDWIKKNGPVEKITIKKNQFDYFLNRIIIKMSLPLCVRAF